MCINAVALRRVCSGEKHTTSALKCDCRWLQPKGVQMSLVVIHVFLQIQYNFQWLQAPISAMKDQKNFGQHIPRIQPLAALNVNVLSFFT